MIKKAMLFNDMYMRDKMLYGRTLGDLDRARLFNDMHMRDKILHAIHSG